MKELLQCGCDCNLGPVEKKVVELMRLHTPPYEILRVLAAAIDNANMENERLERLILTVKEDGVEAVIPTKISDLVDDRGLALATDVTDVRTSLEEQLAEAVTSLGADIDKKQDKENLDAEISALTYTKRSEVQQMIDSKLG